MIDDPIFYLAAVPAVLLYGIAKGGFAGGFGIVAVPLMALAVPVPQAAAIMLPILLVMDLAALWAYRRSWDGPHQAAPAGEHPGHGDRDGRVPDHHPGCDPAGLGVIAVAFVLYRWAAHVPNAAAAPRSAAKGWFWGTVSGLTGFIAHAGSPPLQVYLLPLRLPQALLIGTVTTLTVDRDLRAVELLQNAVGERGGPRAAAGEREHEKRVRVVVLALLHREICPIAGSRIDLGDRRVDRPAGAACERHGYKETDHHAISAHGSLFVWLPKTQKLLAEASSMPLSVEASARARTALRPNTFISPVLRNR